MISCKVMEDFSSFGRCVQEYLNAPNQFARREGELQLCRRIQRAVEAHGGAVSFATIRDEILRSKPAGSASAPFLFAFVVKFASNLLQETESYVKGHASAEKLLGPEFWDGVSGNRKTGQPFVLVLVAQLPGGAGSSDGVSRKRRAPIVEAIADERPANSSAAQVERRAAKKRSEDRVQGPWAAASRCS